uniref:WAP domain-containing protein n=1 Tax=Anas zonorhyncha TaxID=75864 RepID=A0A8B9V544_9AVES
MALPPLPAPCLAVPRGAAGCQPPRRPRAKQASARQQGAAPRAPAGCTASPTTAAPGPRSAAAAGTSAPASSLPQVQPDTSDGVRGAAGCRSRWGAQGTPTPWLAVHRASPPAESPGYCPRAGPSGASCGASCSNDTACGPAEKCCTHSCCARCLPAQPAKPGLCPRKRAWRGTAACPSRCADDRDCPGDHKCCFSGCGLACTSPHTAKPGVCPVVLRGSLGPCQELCDTDSDCPGARKCCSTGCGHVCKAPTEGKATSAMGGQDPATSPSCPPPRPHPVPCPTDPLPAPLSPSRRSGSCPSPCPSWGRGAHPVGQCSSLTRSLCVPPARPGLCPPSATGVGAGECLTLCLQDEDCPPSHKCCLRDCGRACVPPLQGKASPKPCPQGKAWCGPSSPAPCGGP